MRAAILVKTINNQSAPSNYEREEIEKRQQHRKDLLRDQGIFWREFFNQVLDTTPDYFSRIIEAYLIQNHNDSFWGKVELKQQNIHPFISLSMMHSRYLDFGYLGEIEFTQLSSSKTQVVIRNYDDLIPFIEEDESKEIYFNTVEKLDELSNHIKNIFGIEFNQTPGPENTNKDSNPSNRTPNKPGRKPKKGYDLAWEYIIEHKCSNKDAFEWLEKNHPEEFNSLLGNATYREAAFYNFKISMSARNNKANK